MCVKCNREMVCILNGAIVYHPYEHAKPNQKAQEKIGNLTIINTDVLIEGGWKNGDIDFLVNADLYECSTCKHQIATGFGQPLLDYQVPQEELQRMVGEANRRGYAIPIKRKD